MPRHIHLTARFEPDEERTFQHVPFDVPAGTNQIHITISYNNQIDSNPFLTGGNTLDMGLFDQQGTESGGPGLRGWSGSVRTEITIDNEWATPPYRSGDIEGGTWNLLFGAYKVDPNGMDVDITVGFNTDLTAPEVPAWPNIDSLRRTALPPAAEPGWYRGDLHMHTVYSDGDSYPHEVAAVAYSTGLDFYGITDHNRAQSPVDLVPQGNGWPILVPGVEVTTYAGHFNVWGTERWYDFRNPTQEGIQAAADAARADGGLLSLNHPKPYGPAWEFPEITGFDCIEAWNGWWGRLNNMSIGYWSDALNESTSGDWPVGIAGSDTHKNRAQGQAWNPISESTMGYPTLWIHTEEALSASSVIEAIRAGRTFISESPAGPQLLVRRDGDEVVVRVVGAEGDAVMGIGPRGCVDARAVAGSDAIQHWDITTALEAKIPYLRFELHTPTGGVRALSNPVWF